ncbi:uncharacterized protein Dere_GG16272 [Drosophila erecta]|uniref:Uncharacterized protein n=1 Tax=Drosophila erecta TaxID=7220 RepID=B3NEE7_DROER|nr:uncharacterized protein Dere_GG16272 [Drosophila erecta]
MRTQSGKTVDSSGIGSDHGLANTKKHPRKPLCHKSSTHIDHRRDIGDTTKADVQDERVLSLEANEQDGLVQEVYIKSEPLCEDLWDVLDELGDILDEEQADMSNKRQGNIIDREQGVRIYKEEDAFDEEEVEVPPAPPISLNDDTSLFTRRSRPEADVSPFSFNGSLYESGEISSSESAGKKPLGSIHLPDMALVRYQNSSEQRSKRRTPRYRNSRSSNSRSPTRPKERLGPPIHRRRNSQSRDHSSSRRRNYSRDQREQCRRVPSRRKHSSSSLSPDRRSRSRYVRNPPVGRGCRDASPCVGSRHRSRRSPSVGWRRGSRYSPLSRSRYRSRSTSRPTKIGVQHRIESRVYLSGRSRSRSKSKFSRITLSRRVSKSRSRSRNRPLKAVAFQRSWSRSNSPQNRPRIRSKCSSPPAHTHQLNTFENRPRVSAMSPHLPANSPRPICPMVTLHDNRTIRPQEMFQYLLPTTVPQIFHTQTHHTHTEYSVYAGNVPISYGQPFPQLGPYDLRHRLSTSRSFYYVGPNDLRHRIEEIYSQQPALNAYTEWPTGETEQYPSDYY